MSDLQSTAPVEYRTIPRFPDFYRFGSDGSIWSHYRHWKKPRRIHGCRHHKGYMVISIPDREGIRATYLVHRLIAEAFLGPCPEGMQARHLDGNKRNNAITNLCWGTCLENHDDKRRHGTLPRGERNGRAKLTNSDVDQIMRLRGVQSKEETAAQFDIHEKYLSRLWRRKTVRTSQ